MDKSVLYQLRKKNRYSQEDICKLLDISRPLYAQIEKNPKSLTIEQSMKLSDLYKISIESIIENRIIEDEVRLQEGVNLEKESECMRIDVPQKKLQKFRNILLYILAKVGGKPNVGETVLYKLLYFIDFDYYEKYEEQLMGLTYVKNHYGPTPIEFKKVLEEMVKKGDVEIFKSKHFAFDQKKYIALKEPNMKFLGNAQELNHINEVLNRLSDKSAKELSYYSHLDVPWITVEEGKKIKYESVFYRTKETSVREYEGKI